MYFGIRAAGSPGKSQMYFEIRAVGLHAKNQIYFEIRAAGVAVENRGLFTYMWPPSLRKQDCFLNIYP